MAFTALKPCSFGGKKFLIGDTVSEALILPEMVKRLVSMGKIAEVSTPEPPKPRKKKPDPDQKTDPESPPESDPKPEAAEDGEE